MKPRSLLVLLALVLGLGAFILFFERDLPSTDERRELEAKVIDFEVEAITEITLGHPAAKGEAAILLERRAPGIEDDAGAVADSVDDTATATSPPATWWVRGPIEGKADAALVERLLGDVAALRHRRRVEAVPDPATAGLDPPRARLELRRGDAEPLVLLLGDTLPATTARLARIEGRAGAFVVEVPWFDTLDREPGDWRDRRLVSIDRSEIRSLSFTTDGQSLRLARRDDGSFWIESPLADRAERQSVDRLLSAVVDLRAESFLDGEDGEDRGLAPPRAVVSVETGGGEPLVIGLGAPASPSGSVIYAKVGAQTVTTTHDLLLAGRHPVEAWRSTAWTALQVFDIASAQLTDASGTVEVARDGVDWRRDGEKIDRLVATDLLYALVDARGQGVLDRGPARAAGYDLDESELTFQLATDEGIETLHLHPAVDGLAAATSESRRTIVLLDGETIGALREKIAALRAAETLETGDGTTGGLGEGTTPPGGP